MLSLEVTVKVEKLITVTGLLFVYETVTVAI